jgi:hypothetical protein
LPVEPDAVLIDRATEFSSLVDLPAYLARSALSRLRGGEPARIAELRRQQLHSIEVLGNPMAARGALRQIGVQWLVVVGPNRVAFDPSAEQADFRSETVSVYHIRTQP